MRFGGNSGMSFGGWIRGFAGIRWSYLFVLLIGQGAVLVAEEFREWRDILGREFEAKLIEVETSTVRLGNRGGKEIDFPIADLMPSDRSYVRKWQAGRSSAESGDGPEGETAAVTAFAKRVHRRLVRSDGREVRRYRGDNPGRIEYFAFYKSAHWCGPCRRFTPKLVDFYNSRKSEDRNFELIFISSDRSADAMERYMLEMEMPWPAFEYGKMRDVVSSNGGGIPNLIVTDARGNKLYDSYDESGKYVGPSSVMRELDNLIGPDGN